MIQGLVRLRMLRAVMRGPVAGVDLSGDLATAGHHMSPGTRYPLLHDLEKAGWLQTRGQTVTRKRRHDYRATKKGREQLEQALIALNQYLFDGLDPSTTTFRGISDQDKRAPESLRAVVRRVDAVQEDSAR
jgi:DNA-binding PadR family transcriptional regulator